jgi:DNA-binding CsgD family transcriptional regulator
VLYGRKAELAAIQALLEGARVGNSGALVLRGEAGVGKSALLRAAQQRAKEMHLLRGVGVDVESEVAFAGLHHVIRPALRSLEELPGPQRAALESALGLAPPVAPDRFLIGAGVLSLLAAEAEKQPLLCIVDDAHWLDEPSSDALTFAARRLEAEAVAIIFAARDGEARTFDAPGLPELWVEGLDPDAAGELLAQHVQTIVPAVRDRLAKSTGGNPLALLELPKSLSEDQLAGREPLLDPLPVSANVGKAFLERARGLPDQTQTLLLLAAADDTGDPAVVLRAVQWLEISPDAVDAAEAEGLLRITGTGVDFRHPLVRSAVYQGASFAQRQSVHRSLAEVLTDEQYADRRAWHLAAATVGTNAEVADELERSADHARMRSGHGAASNALERAAVLTPDDATRSRRLAASAQSAYLAGRLDRAGALLQSARRLTEDPLLRAEIDHMRGGLELQGGIPAEAHSILLEAQAQIAGVDSRKAAEMLVLIGATAAYAGDREGEIEAGRRAALLRDELGSERFELPLMEGVGALLEGDFARGAPLLSEAISLTDEIDVPARSMWRGSAALYIGADDVARSWLQRAVDQARADGAIAMLAFALSMLSHGEVLEGRFASAGVTSTEGLRLARETGQENCACHHLALLARVAAAQGREDECRALAAEAFATASKHQLGLQAGVATWALGSLELSLGRPAEAIPHFESVTTGGPGVGHLIVGQMAFPELLEAKMKADPGGLADAGTRLFEEWATHTESRPGLALAARCRALRSSGEAANDHFEEALRLHGENGRPFDTARTELLYGEHLRRGRHRKDAREHLRKALDLFEQQGAHAWEERASAELRASGETARRRDPSTMDQLTPQELQIARLVAEGATNKEVAAQLFLSPRTIDFHLRNVFMKLGISSRNELTRLGFADEQPTPSTPGSAVATSS